MYITTNRLIVCSAAIFQEDKTFVVEGNTIQVLHNTNSNGQMAQSESPSMATNVGKVDTPLTNDVEQTTTDDPPSIIDNIEPTKNVNTPPQSTSRKLRRSTRYSTPPKRLTYE